MIKISLISFLSLLSFNSYAEIEKDFENLGGNKILLEKAQALNPDTKITIVQERTVSRRNRWEISPEMSGSFGGDSYVKTSAVGLNVHYHITPRWSVGLKHNKNFSKMTAEGDALIDRALADYEKNPAKPTSPVPDIDFAKEEQLALLNWYPIYGKMNLLDKGVAQFDFYTTLGYGQIKLQSGTKPTYTVGGGMGVWWTKNFTSRLEMRMQNYKAHYIDGEQNMDVAIASFQMGWLL